MHKDQQTKIEQRLERLSLAMGQALWRIQGFEEILAKYYATAFRLSADAALEDMKTGGHPQFRKGSGSVRRFG